MRRADLGAVSLLIACVALLALIVIAEFSL